MESNGNLDAAVSDDTASSDSSFAGQDSASPETQDAFVSPPLATPDAMMREPDAMVREPDATVSEPDASVNGPDAAEPNPVAPSALVINEIEVNNPGDDFEEFVEVLNRTNAGVNLQGVDLVHINGASSNAELGRWALDSATRADGTPVRSLAAGEILVLAQQGSAVLASLPAETARIVHTTPLQNGPDVLQLEDGSNAVIDSVAYEDDIAGYGEGASTQGDLGDDRGLSRCALGSDTNDNSADFVRALLTPAAPNNCP